MFIVGLLVLVLVLAPLLIVAVAVASAVHVVWSLATDRVPSSSPTRDDATRASSAVAVGGPIAGREVAA